MQMRALADRGFTDSGPLKTLKAGAVQQKGEKVTLTDVQKMQAVYSESFS